MAKLLVQLPLLATPPEEEELEELLLELELELEPPELLELLELELLELELLELELEPLPAPPELLVELEPGLASPPPQAASAVRQQAASPRSLSLRMNMVQPHFTVTVTVLVVRPYALLAYSV
ncbi:MAG TPA: hypothetical protein VMI92_07970 [Steroidobacteraceae bacterium]|nr:hypothetical protein [Steroidobacteraceae bacterium]